MEGLPAAWNVDGKSGHLGTFHELFVRPGDLPSYLGNFLCGLETCPFPSVFFVAGRPSVNFREIHVRPGDLSSASN